MKHSPQCANAALIAAAVFENGEVKCCAESTREGAQESLGRRKTRRGPAGPSKGQEQKPKQEPKPAPKPPLAVHERLAEEFIQALAAQNL